MLVHLRRRLLTGISGCLVASAVTATWAAGPSSEQALKLSPVQKNIEYDDPKPDQVAKCTVAVEQRGKNTGWVVKSPEGQVLRRFLDTNGDNVVDLWSYYHDGFEVYRDIDSNHNGKADQYRWIGPGGTRWAVDENEDGKIDSWKAISAEEASAEVVLALAHRDPARFSRLKLTVEELAKLGLGDEKKKQLQEQLDGLDSQFAELSSKQKVLDRRSTWQRFDALRPGIIPTDTDGSTADVKVYENVVALAKTEEQSNLVQIGTLVQIGDRWRVIDLPKPLAGDDAEPGDAGFFFRTSIAKGETQGEAATGQDSALQKLLGDLEKLDRATGEKALSPEAQAAQAERRIGLLEQLMTAAQKPEDREQWTRQLADTIGMNIQADPKSNGVARLKSLSEKTKRDPEAGSLAAYVEFRYLMADYTQRLQQPKADFAKIQTTFLENLEAYVKAYPDSPDTAEALLQLGMAQELAGQDEEAQNWYRVAVKNFPETAPGKKAAGAARRLASTGNPMKLAGKSVSGQAVDIARYQGRVVLIDYWATWCEPCKEEFETLKQLSAKYGKAGFSIIGVSLDSNEAELLAYLKQNRLPWIQLYEPGGLESRFANEMGILTLPTKILVDAKGNVLHRNIHVSQIEDELKKVLEGAAAADPKEAKEPKRPETERTATKRKSGNKE